MESHANGASSSCSDVPLVLTVRRILGEEREHMVLKTCSQVSKMVSQGLPVTDDLIRRMVIEDIQPDEERLLNEGTRNEFPEERSLQLKFLDNKVADTVTGEELKGLTEESLKLVLLDSNEHTVTCGPGSSAKVDILLLENNGDGDENNMTREKFERSIIQRGDKKRPHISSKCDDHIFLKNGVAELKKIKLGHASDWNNRCSCRLGVRIGQNLEGTTVQEAWTAPFEVRDKRLKQNGKNPCPYLTSEVWRLKGISRTGERRDRLRKKYIETVQDFLFWYHVNPEELQNKILGVGDGTWKKIVSNAQSCQIDCEKMFCHKSSSEPQRCVIYDCVGKLKGEMMESQFVGIDNMCADKKDDAFKLLRSVLERASVLYEDEKEFTYPITSTICDYEPLGSKGKRVVSNPGPQLTPLPISGYELEGFEVGSESAPGGEMVKGGGLKERVASASTMEPQLFMDYEYYHGSPNPMLYNDDGFLSVKVANPPWGGRNSPVEPAWGQVTAFENQNSLLPHITRVGGSRPISWHCSAAQESQITVPVGPVTKSQAKMNLIKTVADFTHRFHVDPEELKNIVIEGFQLDEERLLSEGTRNEFPEERSLQLKFLDNKVADTVTGEELKGLTEESLKLVLLDSNEHTVTCGPGSSAKVEILLLEDNGDGDENNMTIEKFERSIIQKGDTKKPHFAKSVYYILLKNGVVDLDGIKLGHGIDWIKLCCCRLGARIGQNLEGTTVQEAWTAPFKVKDKRNKLYDTYPCPYLTSEVWRLRGISRIGKHRDRLRTIYIETVQDFLFWYHVNPEELKNRILDVGDGRWKTIVSHAQSCKVDCEKMFCHKSSSEPQRCVIYDCVGKLKGEMMESQFVGIDNMSADRKDDALKLLRSVLERASALYDEEKEFPYPLESREMGEADTEKHNSLEEHLAGLHPFSDRTEVGGSSSSTHVFDSVDSIMNLLGEQTDVVQEFAPSPAGSFFENLDEYIPMFGLEHDQMNDWTADDQAPGLADAEPVVIFETEGGAWPAWSGGRV